MEVHSSGSTTLHLQVEMNFPQKTVFLESLDATVNEV